MMITARHVDVSLQTASWDTSIKCTSSTVLVSVVAAADDAAMKIIHMKNVSVVYARISEAK